MNIPIIDVQATGQNILNLRKQNGLSVSQLQSMLGLSTRAIYQWQYGNYLPSVDNLLALSQIFGVPMEQILVYEYNDCDSTRHNPLEEV